MSIEKTIKAHDKPTTLNVNGASHHCPIPVKHNNQYYHDGNSIYQYQLVNIIKGHDKISAGGLVQVVKRNGKYMLTLGGTNSYSENSKNLLN